MIPVPPPPEPPDFDERVRRPGAAWLADHADAPRPRDLWSPFRAELARGFGDRCGYSAMFVPDGSVDHYRSWKARPDLTYEWDNLRFSAQWLNSAKRHHEVLDPFEVGDDWFEVRLPGLELVLTNKVPIDRRELAAATLKRLPIVDDPRIIKQRRRWYEMHESGELSLEGLRRMAPLVAAAVERNNAASRRADAGPDAP